MNDTVDVLINLLKDKGHTVFEKDDKEFNLNLVGVRNSNGETNKFDDTLYVFYKYKGEWTNLKYRVTVDPGAVYLRNPINHAGTAIIMPGQYKGMWELGLHKGKYKALVQKGRCTVARDNNRDLVLNSKIPPYVNSYNIDKGGITTTHYVDKNLDDVFITETGMFGINCHKSGKGNTVNVNYYSAGCVVFADNYMFEESFIPVCEAAASTFGNSFSFTLI